MKNGQIAVVARVMLNEHIFDWGVGIIGNTLPLHGGIIGSSPVRSTIQAISSVGERLLYTQDVAGSIPASPTKRASYNGIT